jgi:hypothetical protein
MWVAEVDGRLAGMRVLMRWDFVGPAGARMRAVRAVDTATHPDFQGRGIFTALTRHALEELESAGIDFVFNTPNDQSRPGYLKMGWEVVGRVPVWVRPLGLRGAARMARARQPAAKWSEPTSGGAPPRFDHGDGPALRSTESTGLATARDEVFLRWRYGFEPLGYRMVRTDDGIAVFRLRRRGAAIEAVVADVVAERRAPTERALRRVLRRETPADYVIAAGPRRMAGSVPLVGQGPVLTWRAVGRSDRPPLRQWSVGLGDIELF